MGRRECVFVPMPGREWGHGVSLGYSGSSRRRSCRYSHLLAPGRLWKCVAPSSARQPLRIVVPAMQPADRTDSSVQVSRTRRSFGIQHPAGSSHGCSNCASKRCGGSPLKGSAATAVSTPFRRAPACPNLALWCRWISEISWCGHRHLN